MTGLQVVQSRRLHGIGTGVRRPRHRLAGVGAQILFTAVLQAALHLQARGIHQGP